MASPSFASLFDLRPVPSPSSSSSTPTYTFRLTPPRAIAVAGVDNNSMYGGYLLAMALKSVATVARSKGYPDILSMQLDVLAGIPPEEVEITVEILRSTRRLCFLRMTTIILSKSSIGLLSQAVAGHLAPLPGAVVVPARTIISDRYALAPHTAAAPSLTNPNAGAGGYAGVVGGALGFTAEEVKRADRMRTFFKITHATEAVEYVEKVVRNGAEAVRNETWHALDKMPRIIQHPDGVPMDEIAAAFYADHNALSAIINNMLGPNVPSVTTSISLQFFSRIPPCDFLYMVSDVPVEPLPAGPAPSLDGKHHVGSVAYLESRLWTPTGELVCFQRQTKMVVSGEVKAGMERQLMKALETSKI
ncbi:hypothetical protein M427DRAFT_42195 [Gonapodya prolifera JEL478]|uniref:Acyl-CoA thioesterase-like N-terminal HotDog domain-containing protein n=1 Tax=Gonapodya prolifera (strain JEL478) TaxID=1344416 RepID=A0A139AQC0_GONPJ|nr:hypothetical protein M427DRAFT_42195 [Gonapodya prolifera JEL478]|eukprot:KXS18936.1 hypothetical protein M427DRAFT_42195 [Gonapodya prolifera JEL478]